MKQLNQITCCAFDLETTNLNADFGVILCGVVKPAGHRPIVFRADELNPEWDSCRSNDREVVQAIVAELVKWDIWIAHNGARFDVPYLRTRLARWGLPPLPSHKLVDPVLLARNKLRMSYNSLEQIATFLKVGKKTPVASEKWLAASLDGDRDAMNYIVRHCVVDVEVLDRVVGRLKHYSGQLNSWGSGF